MWRTSSGFHPVRPKPRAHNPAGQPLPPSRSAATVPRHVIPITSHAGSRPLERRTAGPHSIEGARACTSSPAPPSSAPTPRVMFPVGAADHRGGAGHHLPAGHARGRQSFGAPIGGVVWSALVKSQAELATDMTSLLTNQEYLDLLVRSSDDVAGRVTRISVLPGSLSMSMVAPVALDHDAPGDVQAQAGALADLLGREERLERALRRPRAASRGRCRRSPRPPSPPSRAC